MASGVFLAEGVVVESLGDEVLVLVPDGRALRLSGPASAIVVQVVNGQAVNHADDAVTALVNAGVLVVADREGVSRRGVVTLGAAAVGAGIVALALPATAAASSTAVLEGFWVWDDLWASDQNRQDPRGYRDPTWRRSFFVYWDDHFTPPTTDPSSLSAIGQEFGYIRLFTESGPVPPGGDGSLIFFNTPSTNTTHDKDAPLTGDITGTFTWGGVTHELVFVQGVSLVGDG